MAKATRKMEKVPALITVYNEVPMIVLELTEAEAQTLKSVQGRVGGSPTGSYRGDMDRIGAALAGAGISSRASNTLDGSLHFRDC